VEYVLVGPGRCGLPLKYMTFEEKKSELNRSVGRKLRRLLREIFRQILRFEPETQGVCPRSIYGYARERGCGVLAQIMREPPRRDG
jgi:hypothetical protein